MMTPSRGRDLSIPIDVQTVLRKRCRGGNWAHSLSCSMGKGPFRRTWS